MIKSGPLVGLLDDEPEMVALGRSMAGSGRRCGTVAPQRKRLLAVLRTGFGCRVQLADNALTAIEQAIAVAS